jgi:hypothetical protein
LTKLLVVDASVAVAACHTPVGFARLRGHKLLAPQLMVTEASSALHEMAWRGEITKPRAKTMLARLLKAPVEIRTTAWFKLRGMSPTNLGGRRHTTLITSRSRGCWSAGWSRLMSGCSAGSPG